MDPQQILVNAQDALIARRVFGDPIHVDGVAIVPAAVVSGGGGDGGGLMRPVRVSVRALPFS